MGDLGGDGWAMVVRKGNQFMINDQPFYVNGFNTYWLMVFAVDRSTRGKVSEVFQQASSVGLSVCRTWGFNDGQWRALQKSPGVYDEEVFKVPSLFLFFKVSFYLLFLNLNTVSGVIFQTFVFLAFCQCHWYARPHFLVLFHLIVEVII